eukprot:4393798-Heterocapsa_arctica.AAC.1
MTFSQGNSTRKGIHTGILLQKYRGIEDFDAANLSFAQGNVSFASWWDPQRLYNPEDDFLSARILDFLPWEAELPCTM